MDMGTQETAKASIKLTAIQRLQCMESPAATRVWLVCCSTNIFAFRILRLFLQAREAISRLRGLGIYGARTRKSLGDHTSRHLDAEIGVGGSCRGLFAGTLEIVFLFSKKCNIH